MKLYVDNLENIEIISFEKFPNSFEVQGDNDVLVEYPKRYKVENGILIDAGLLEVGRERLRIKRNALLKAFDIYKSNVIYGLVSETEEENAIMTKWYLGLLDMRESAILHEVPSKVAYYI